MLVCCPKCRHQPLPADQALPAACPACGVILAKVAPVGALAGGGPAHAGSGSDPMSAGRRAGRLDPVRRDERSEPDDETGWRALLLRVPERVDTTLFWGRAALWAAFAVWGLWLMRCSVAEGEIGQSFIHRPLLIFHEAGHVLFMPFGRWMTVAGGTLMQWLVPAVLAGALLLKNRDPFGASFGLWLLGVSILDAAPYLYDALHPQLTLLGGGTGADGGHDFIFLLDSVGWRPRAQALGLGLHKVGALVTLAALAWGAWLLVLQHGRRVGVVLHE
jgi:hypothetical protein